MNRAKSFTSLHMLVFLLGIALLLVPIKALAADGGSTSLAADGGSAGLAAGTTEQVSVEATAVGNPQIRYKAYMGKKWTSWKKNGATVGAAGKKFQVFRLKTTKSAIAGKVKYRVYQKGKGWSKWATNGKKVGTKGWYMRGIQVRLTGKLAKKYDVMYRVYLNKLGWQPWTTNGGTAGSTGKLGQIEKVKVKLVAKGTQPRLADGAYFITYAKNPNAVVQLPGSKTKSNVQMTRTTFKKNATKLRFYVRNQSDGTIAIQSCASGLYLCDSNGKVVQRSNNGSANFRWKVSTWRGGYALKNSQTGKWMRFAGAKIITGSSWSRLAFSRTDVLANGTYMFFSAAKGNMLAVKDESVSKGAKLLVQSRKKTNAEVFTLTRAASNTYWITNVGSGKRIEVAKGSTAENAVVRQYSKSSAARQKWKVVFDASGKCTLVNMASGKALTAAGSGASGSYARSSADKGAATQRWTVRACKAYPQSPEKLAVERATNYAKTASSNTSYFITVDLTNHWMCIFKGAKGKRTLVKSWQCSTGAPGSGTPTGNYIINGNTQYEFGNGYSCYYATGFIGWVYLFHSVKYFKNTHTILDGRLGQSVSEGCVRLDINNAKWLYNSVNRGTIPYGTRVKIYY